MQVSGSAAAITGCGKCMPPAILTNDDLSQIMDTSDDWIRSRTGIAERRVSHVPTSELAFVASARALASAGLDAEELDLVILATSTPDTLIPCAAAHLQRMLGARNSGAFDMNAGCTGFLYALAIGASMVQSGLHRKVLIAGAERLTWYLDWSRRDTAVLFGDGAGAVVIEPAGEERGGLLAWNLGCDGEAAHVLSVPDFGTNVDRLASNRGHFEIQFDGREMFRRAVAGMAEACLVALEHAGIDLDQVDLLVPHQANQRIIEALTRRLGVDRSRVMINIGRYGNTSTATIPVALTESLEERRVEPGQCVLMTAFGAGLTWGAAVMRWVGPRRPSRASDVQLPECAQTGLELIAENAKRHNSRARLDG